MRKVCAVILFLVLTILPSGCSIDKEFVQAVEANWEAIKPEYVAYFEADESLSDADKEARRLTVKLFDDNIAAHKDEEASE